MRKIWFEQTPPAYVDDLLDGAVEAIICPDIYANRHNALDEAHATIAGALGYTAEDMDAAPNLLVISRIGIGYDNVDVAAATARGIAVCNAPDGPTISTAEHTIALMMSVARSIKAVERDLHENDKKQYYDDYQAIELDGKQLGLVGFGRIGARVAAVARAIGMTVVTYDPYVSEKHCAEQGVLRVETLEKLLQTSDVVSLHLPLNESTRHTINATTLAQMKRGAILINAARGGHVDEAALIDAIDSGHLFGAGLDVTEIEPPRKDNPLLHRDNVVVTPHIASGTTAGKRRMISIAVSQAVQVCKGEKPPHLVNPEVWEAVLSRLG